MERRMDLLMRIFLLIADHFNSTHTLSIERTLSAISSESQCSCLQPSSNKTYNYIFLNILFSFSTVFLFLINEDSAHWSLFFPPQLTVKSVIVTIQFIVGYIALGFE